MNMNDSRPPFRVLGLQQVALGGLKREPIRKLWTELFGLEIRASVELAGENVREDKLVLGSGPCSVELDIMEPIDPNKSPRVHEPALNHIGLWIDDLEQAVSFLRAQGVRFAGGIRENAEGMKIAFIHPKSSEEFPLSGEGILIELVQAPQDIITSLEEISSGS